MIKIGFTGDFCPINRIEEEFISGNWKHLFSEVIDFFQFNDLNVIDLECPLTTHGQRLPKTGPHLKGNPGTTEILEYLNCKLVATANNHFKDFGWEGMQQTYLELKNRSIEFTGSGSDYKEASSPHFININGVSVAFINATDREWSTTEGNEPGCNPLDAVALYNTIQDAASEADFTIVIAHGGHEHFNLPSPRIKKLYRFFIDAGASAVVGHHTHIIGAYEVYKNAPIFYSLGNFCFDWPGLRNNTWNYGMLLQLNLNKNKLIEFETTYIEQNNAQPAIKRVDENKKTELEQLQHYLNLTVMNEAQLQFLFDDYADSRKGVMNSWIQPYTGRYLPSLHKKGLLPNLMGKKKKQLLTVLTQCETHREVLLHSIDPRKNL